MAIGRVRPRTDTAFAERRSHERYETDEPALVIADSGAAPCRLSDISLGGALLEGDLPLNTGDAFALCVLDLPELTGRVVHCGNGFYGVQFADDREMRVAIRTWIQRRMAGR